MRLIIKDVKIVASGNKVVHANISDEKIKEDYIKLIYDFINLKSES